MLKEKIIGDHVLYGEWDDCGGYQFLVYYHPNGIHAQVFMLAGTDYGGGVTKYADCLVDDLQKVLAANTTDKYERYEAMSSFVKGLTTP